MVKRKSLLPLREKEGPGREAAGRMRGLTGGSQLVGEISPFVSYTETLRR